MADAILYSYLRDYLQWARDVGVPRYNKFVSDRIIHIGGTTERYVKRHNEYNSLLRGEYPQVDVLHGGKASIDKLNKIYNAIKSIKPSYLHETRDDVVKIDQLLDEIQKKLDSVKINDDLSVSGKVLASNAIIDTGIVQTTINTIKAGLVNLNSVDITKDQGKIPQQLMSKVNYTRFDVQSTLDNFNKELARITADKTTDDALMEKALLELKKKIDDVISNVNAKNTELVQVINDIESSLKIINESLDYTLEGDELKIVPEFDGFLDNLKGIFLNRNEELAKVIDKIRGMKKNLSDRVDVFNNEILPHIMEIRENTQYKHFTKYYDGINNSRINNMFFVKDGLINIPIVRDLITQDDLIKDTPSGRDFNLMFLEFPKINNVDEKKTVQQIVQQFKMKGGSSIETIKSYLAENGELMSKLYEYNNNLDIYNKKINEHKTTLIHQLMHSIFLVMIATNQMLMPGYVIHEYIQRGALSLYNRILKNMVNDIENEPMKPQNLYLLKYHKFTIYKLRNFVRELTDHMNLLKSKKMNKCPYQKCEKGINYEECLKIRKLCLDDDVIDINECTGKTADRFLLLNHFKGILMQYNVLSGNKITIYARINDLGQTMPPNDETSCKELMYLSMFDEVAQRGKCGQPIVEQDDVQKDKLKPIDIQNMVVNLDVCKSLSSININPEKLTDDMKNIKFTEVFDPTQFPTSSDISKYMTIDTLLSQGNGIGMMTYGYSGTGKSFTLFGNSASQIAGILQTTLNDMNGLKSVDFRLIELYGYGMPYPDYWKGGPETIYHSIFNYKTNISDSKLVFNEVSEVPASKFSDYMNCINEYKDTYYRIPENMISSVFRKFEIFVDNVDKRREIEGRIRDTPNNPVSSRSVVIYDFQLNIADKKDPVPFLIVDLPGREEIVQTYVEPYLGNDTILELLKLQPNDNEYKKLKLILSIAALNPLGLSVFESDIVRSEIINYIKNGYSGESSTREERLKKIIGPFQMEFEIIESDFHKRPGYGGVRKYLEKHHVGKNILPDDKDVTKYKLSGEFSLLDEPINFNGYQLSNLVTFDNVKLQFGIKKNKDGKDEIGYGYTFGKQNEIVLSTHLLNRVIMKNRFDILKNIIMKVCDKHINSKIKSEIDKMRDDELRNKLENLRTKNFKSLYWY